MAKRSMISGFETGDLSEPWFTGSPSNISVTTGAKRSGDYGLRVNAQANTENYFTVTSAPPTLFNRQFFRWYLYIVTMPTGRRYILRHGSSTASASRWDLCINSSGTIGIGSNGSPIASSATALSTGQWYRIELGWNFYTGNLQLVINGEIEVDWTAADSNLTTNSNQYVCGALGTSSTSACEFYMDDFAIDSASYAGQGKVVHIRPDTIESDNANWSLGAGASKIAAISDSGIPDGSSSYISCTTTSQAIDFSFPDMPADCYIPRAAQFLFNANRSTSGSQVLRCDPVDYMGQTQTVTNTINSATYATFAASFTSISLSHTSISSQLSNDYLNTLKCRLTKNSGSNAINLTYLVLQVDYDDNPKSTYDPYRALLADFEQNAMTDEFGNTATTLGTIALSTTRAKRGSTSLRMSPANGARGYIQTQLSGAENVNNRVWTGAFWIWIETRQSSGNLDIGGIYLNTNIGAYICVDTSGGIAYRTNATTGSFTASNTLQTGKWHHVAYHIEYGDSSNGVIKVWVDSVIKINENTLTMVSYATPIYRFGTATNVTGGCDVYYDQIIIETGWKIPTPDSIISTLNVAGAGSRTVADFTVSGAASKYEALDESGYNDDTDYVVTNNTLASRESYAFDQIPSDVTVVYGYRAYARHKQDGGSSGNIIYEWGKSGSGTPMMPITISNLPGSSYATVTNSNVGGNYQISVDAVNGFMTKDNVNAIEIIIRENSATQKSRVTGLKTVVEYTKRRLDAPVDMNGTGYIQPATNTIEFTGTGIVSITPTAQVTATGIVNSQTTKNFTSTGIVYVSDTTKEFSADGYIGTITNTSEVTGSGIVQRPDITSSFTSSALVQSPDITKDLTGTGYLEINSITKEVTGTGIVQNTVSQNTTASGIVVTPDITKDLTGDGYIEANTITKEITGTAVVQITPTASIAGSGVVLYNNGVKELTADGYIGNNSTTKDFTASGIVAIQRTKDLTATAIVQAPVVTKLYLSNATPAWSGNVASPAGSWNVSSFAKAYMTEEFNSWTASQNRAVAETSGTNPTTVGIMMFASPEFSTSKTISGNMDFIIGAMESSASANMVIRLHAYVTVGNSQTIRGTLLNNWTDDSTNELSTSMGSAPLWQIPVNTVTAQAGDYLIVEVGVSAFNSSTTSYNGRIYYGAPTGTTTELTVGNSSVTTRLGWIGFTDDLPFLYTPSPPRDFTGTGIVRGEISKSLSSSGYVIGPNENKEITASAIARGEATKEATATGLVRDTRTADFISTGLIQISTTISFDATAITRSETEKTFTATGTLFGTYDREFDGTTIVQDTFNKEFTSTALVLISPVIDFDATAITRDTLALDTLTTALVQDTFTAEIVTTGTVLSTNLVEINGQAWIVIPVDKDLLSTGVISVIQTLEVMSDAMVIGVRGTIKGQFFGLSPLTATPLVIAPITAEGVSMKPLDAEKACFGDIDDLSS